MTGDKLCWLDISAAGPAARAIIEEAVHQRVNGIEQSFPDSIARSYTAGNGKDL